MSSNGCDPDDPFLLGKAYTTVQAAKLAGTTASTVRRWLLGYEQPGHQMAPVLGRQRWQTDTRPLIVSFLELIEIVVVARFRTGDSRRSPVKLGRLRRARDFAQHAFRLPYPFATLKLKEYGGHVLHEFQEADPGPGMLALDLGGQFVLPDLVRHELDHNLDFKGLFAERWFPQGRRVPIVVDPHIAAGRPVIIHSGVTLDTLVQRWQAGETISGLARDYGLKRDLIEEVLKHAA